VVGSDKNPDNTGWTRTVFYDIASGAWSTLPLPDKEIIKKHKELVDAVEKTIDLTGRIRGAWYRDPAGSGTEEERKEIDKLAGELKKLPGAKDVSKEIDQVISEVKSKKLLQGLKTGRAFQRTLEDASFAQYPVPPSRRNTPLAYNEKDNCCILFGGDHEDYLMNDTWMLDLSKNKWERKNPDKAPAPRAGHALVYLPKSGTVMLYEGYNQTSSIDYGAAPYWPKNPLEMWLYNTKENRWKPVGVWPHPKKGDMSALPPVGHFYGYSADKFSPPAIASDGEDRIVFSVHSSKTWYMPWKKYPAQTWMMKIDSSSLPKLNKDTGSVSNTRLYRKNFFVASYCEVETQPKPTNIDKLPPNKWVKLPNAPRNPCRGCRQRDWGTYVWDSDRDQILLWGGGHCVRSPSNVAHYSPVSGRYAEGYDADEPYGANGGGGYDSSVMNRPWISVHNYNHYAYDPKCKLLVTTRGYLYDPSRMDWLREPRIKQPFKFSWGSTLAETTPYGAVVWAQRAKGGGFSLWLFDRKKGWTDLAPQGKLRGLYCDSEGVCYDSKRDRLLLGYGGGYGKRGDGRIDSFDFKTKKLTTIMPANSDIGKMANTREMVYIPEADIVLFGSDPFRVGDKKKGRILTRVYHCEKNTYMLLDAGSVTYGHSSGWMYDAKRKNVYAISCRGQCWAMHIDPKSLTLLEKPPEK
ncbi:kelch repeat-containing protein, partial [Planctomycetota bacterium]